MELQLISRASESQILIAEKLKSKLPTGCRRILLIEPPNVPEEDWDPEVAANNRYPVYDPKGLAILSSCLELRGYETDIIDLNFMIQNSFKSDPQNFRYALWKEWLRNKIDQFQPDVIGITCMFTIYHRAMARIAKFVKELNPNIVIVAGGVHTTMASINMQTSPGQLVLEDCREIDFVGLYECEDSFPNFLDVSNGKITQDNLTQVATLINNNYMAVTKREEPRTETLNILPNYHDLPVGRYSSIGRIGTYYWLFPPGTKAATVRVNHGCRAHCRFCSVEKMTGKGVVIKRDPEAVYDELEMLQDIGISHVMLLDDDIFNDEKEEGRTVNFFNGWAKRKIKITWDASNGVIASALSDEIAHAVAESGCIALSFGIESGNPLVLKNIPKPSGVHHYLKAGLIMKKYPRIFTRGLLMVGFPPEPERNFPGESIDMIWDTINVAREMDLDWYTIQPLNLIPGVEITNHAVARGEIEKQSLIDGTERPVIGSTGHQNKRSGKEKEQALPFVNYLSESDRAKIPTRQEIIDIWFAMDYYINYEKMWQLRDSLKIDMLHKMFINMCDKTHKENALGNLYFALLEHKRGNSEQARYRLNLSEEYATSNDYWRKRFPALKLDEVIKKLQILISGETNA